MLHALYYLIAFALGIVASLAFIFLTVWFEDWKTFRVKGRATPADWQKKWEICPKDEIMAFANVAGISVHWHQNAGGYVITREAPEPSREHILMIVGYFAGMDEWRKAAQIVRQHDL